MKIRLIISILFLMAVSKGYAQVPEAYLNMAVENNPGLKAAYLEFEAALQRIPQAKSLPDPSLMAGYMVWPSETMPGMEKARISLSQMFPWFGTLKAKGDEAALRAEALYHAYIDRRNNVFFQLAEAWYPLYEINRFRNIEQENITLLNSYKQIAMRNFENGTGPMVDVLRADLMLTDANTRLSILDDREESLASSFNSLLNRDSRDSITIPDTLALLKIPESGTDTILINNPRIKELEFRYDAAESSTEAARKQGYPAVGIGIEYMFMGNQAEQTSHGMKKGAVMPMVTVSLPVNRKKYKAAVQEATLIQESIAYQKENTLNILTADYSRTLSELKQQQKMITRYNRQIQVIRQSLNLLFQSYSNSGNEFEEVLRMQQQLLQYEKEKASAETALFLAQAQINYLTGNTSNYNEDK